jgi:spore coat protein U-like protein
MTVRFEVAGTCQLSVDNLIFGVYDPRAAQPLTGETTVKVHCNAGMSFSLAMDAGRGAGALTTRRRMTGPAATLDYGLYRDASHTQVWGDATGQNTLVGRGTGKPQEFRAYGAVLPLQRVPAGTYSDVVTVRILF